MLWLEAISFKAPSGFPALRELPANSRRSDGLATDSFLKLQTSTPSHTTCTHAHTRTRARAHTYTPHVAIEFAPRLGFYAVQSKGLRISLRHRGGKGCTHPCTKTALLTDNCTNRLPSNCRQSPAIMKQDGHVHLTTFCTAAVVHTTEPPPWKCGLLAPQKRGSPTLVLWVQEQDRCSRDGVRRSLQPISGRSSRPTSSDSQRAKLRCSFGGTSPHCRQAV